MGAWPDLTEYHEAVQHPPKAFADPGLKGVTLELDRFGMPKPATGGNAVVYKANEPGGLLTFKKTWAIRCFLRPISDHAERYEAISKHLRKVRLPYDVDFQFLKQGIQIRSTWFPIVKMQWAKGDLLHSHIEKHLGYPAALAALRAKWAILVRHLAAARVAHGDLQHGNILVRGGSIQLVDYDGMWVPALCGRHATEIGHRAYQHPERSGQDYGQAIDRFFSSRHLSVAGGAGEGCHPVGTFSYRRQSDLRARRFPAGGSIGDLAAITSSRIAGNRSTRRCPGGHGAAAADEGRESR